MKMKRKKISVLFIVLFLGLFLYSLSLIALLSWGLLTSLRDNLSFLEDPFSLSGFGQLKNYLTVFLEFSVTVSAKGGGYMDVFVEDMFVTSLIYAGGCSLVNTFVTCTGAYCAAKYDFKICKFLPKLIVVVMILPIVGSLPAEVNMAKMLGIYGTMGGMFIMKASFSGTYFLVFMAIFKGVPKDYSEAASIDGANDFNIYFNIMLSMAKDTFLTIFLLSFIAFWNDYSTPLIYLPNSPPLALGLYKFNLSTDNRISSVPVKLAGCFFVLLPIVLIFLVFQKKLTGNLSMGGLKE